ncbi:hypothetical protein BU16DRAFT_554829 [Lophium mytilinum]|uniref:Uncharacterized protein n=1 Tax=Lophium mytilinum TaxID=390894 RepID=A0A6A6RDH2_9PEZI|nr:hypothetical protein BU16DRAFT_554829 [Lophium mytilinum]
MQLRASIRPPRVFNSSTGSWQNASSEPDNDFEPAAESDSASASQVDSDSAAEIQPGTTDLYNETDSLRRPRGRPNVRVPKTGSTAAPTREASSTHTSTFSTSQPLTSTEPSFLRHDTHMANNRANGRADLRRTAAHNRTTKKNRNRSCTPRDTSPRPTEAFPSLPLNEPRLRPRTAEGSHGIESLLWERSSGQTKKWRESFISVDISDDSDGNGHVDMEDSDLEEHPKIAFASLWPSLRWEIITQILQEGQQTYLSATHAVQALLNLELEDIAKFRLEALELGDDVIPPHIIKWKLEHPNEPIDPEEAPPGELKRAYDFLRQEKLPSSLLGLLGVEDGDTGEVTTLCQGDEDDESTGHDMDPDGANSSQPPTSQHRDIREDSARENSGFGENHLHERNAPAALESKGSQPHLENGNVKNRVSETLGFMAAPPLQTREQTTKNKTEARQVETSQSRPALPKKMPTSALQEPSKICQSTAATIASTPSLSQARQHLKQSNDATELGQSSPRALEFPTNPPSAFKDHSSPPAQLSQPRNQPCRAPPAVMVSPQSALFNRRQPDSTPPKAFGLERLTIPPNLYDDIMERINKKYPGISKSSALHLLKKAIASRYASNVGPHNLPNAQYSSNPQVWNQNRQNMETTPAPMDGMSASSLSSPSARDPQAIQTLLEQQRKARNSQFSRHGQTQNPPSSHGPHPTQAASQQQWAPNDAQNLPYDRLGISPPSDPRFGLLLQQQWRPGDAQDPRNAYYSASPKIIDRSLASLSQQQQNSSNAPNNFGSRPFDSPQGVDPRLAAHAFAQLQQRLRNAQIPSNNHFSGSPSQIDPRLTFLSQQQQRHSNAQNPPNGHPSGFPQAVDPTLATSLAQHQRRLSSDAQNFPTGYPFDFPPNMDLNTAALAVSQHQQRLTNARAAPEGQQVPVYGANLNSAQTASQFQHRHINVHASPNIQLMHLPVGNGEGSARGFTPYQGVVQNGRTLADPELKNFPLGDDPVLARAMAQRQQNIEYTQPLPNGQPRISPTSLKSGSAQMALAEQRFVTATPPIQRVQVTPDSQGTNATPSTHRVQAAPSTQSFQAYPAPTTPSLGRPTPSLSTQSVAQNQPTPGQVWTDSWMHTQRLATPHHQRTMSNSSSSNPSGNSASTAASSVEGSDKRRKTERMKERLDIESKTAQAYLQREVQKQQVSESNIDPALRDQKGTAGGMPSVRLPSKDLPSSGNPYHHYPYQAFQNPYQLVRDAVVSPSPIRPQPSYPENMAMTALEARLAPHAISAGGKRKRDENGDGS